MRFTDIFIRRPVLATVVSLMILVLGLRSYGSLPVLQFPRTENTVVTVTTNFYGADPDVIAGFITTPLENAIAQANGIDYMTSTSTPGVSTITVNLRLNYEADKALTEISTKVSSVLNQLPPGSQQPTFTVKVGQTIDAMYIGFSSDVLTAKILGHTGDITRFATAGHYASYTGTAPIEASSGPTKRHRLNPRGNRQLNHAMHIAAITQIGKDTPGRAYYQRKIAEGKSNKEALRALKRKISDAVYRPLVLDAAR